MYLFIQCSHRAHKYGLISEIDSIKQIHPFYGFLQFSTPSQTYKPSQNRVSPPLTCATIPFSPPPNTDLINHGIPIPNHPVPLDRLLIIPPQRLEPLSRRQCQKVFPAPSAHARLDHDQLACGEVAFLASSRLAQGPVAEADAAATPVAEGLVAHG